MNKPKLSIVIPTFNRSASLTVTLEGLNRQDFPADQFEVIVVSDGSTDNTPDVVAAHRAKANHAVSLVTQQNSGPSVARNRGVATAANEVVVFLDDDVEPMPGFLEFHAAAHALNETSAIIGPMSPDPTRRNIEPVWITWEHEKLQRIYCLFKEGGPYPEGECGPMHFYSGNASVHRSLLLESSGFDPRFTRQEDVELAVRLKNNYGVRFFFEFRADGIHRPVRTFESWLKIPRDYGRLDAQRLADGSIDYEEIRGNFENRHPFSRTMAGMTQRWPASNAGPKALQAACLLLAKVHWRKPASLLLSGLYNAVYNQAFFNERNHLLRLAQQPEERQCAQP